MSLPGTFEFEAVRAALKARSPQWMPPRAVSVREPFDPCNEALFAERTADRFGGPQPRECEGVAQARKEAREIGNAIADGRQRRDAVVLACEVGAAARPAPIACAVDQTRGGIASGRQHMRLSLPKIETLMELRLWRFYFPGSSPNSAPHHHLCVHLHQLPIRLLHRPHLLLHGRLL